MDFVDGEPGRERFFVLHVMNFVYGLRRKPLECSLQEMLDKYPREEEKYCTKSIIEALLLYISDYLDSSVTLVDIASPAFQVQTEDLLALYVPYDFLRFFAHYAWKSCSDYYERKLLDSPVIFYSSMVRFLEQMRRKGKGGAEFWNRLDKAAAKVAEKVLETIKSRDSKCIEIDDYDYSTSEREFILMIMNTIARLYKNPLPYSLKSELDEFMLMSQYDFHPSFGTAFEIASDNLERSITNFLNRDEVIYDYYYRLATASFSTKHFLEFCVCCTRKALLDFYVNSNPQSPIRACDRLCLILKNAKQDGKYSSVTDFIEGANEIIEDERMKAEYKAEHKSTFSDASTEFFSDVSTESTGPFSDRDSMFESCEYSLKNANICKNEKPDKESVIPAAKDSKLGSAVSIRSGKDVQPVIENVITIEKISELATANVTESAPSDTGNVMTAGGNAQPVIENIVASTENASGSESGILASSSEQTTKRSPCCTTL